MTRVEGFVRVRKCEHEVQGRGVCSGSLRACRKKLERVGSIDVIPRSVSVVHSRDDDAPEPYRGQTWAVYRCGRNHETRILEDASSS